MKDSVHLNLFPEINKFLINEKLVTEMAKIRAICSTALSIRKEANVKVRMPLNLITIYGENIDFVDTYKEIILEELNVKKVEINKDISLIGSEILSLNLKLLGQKMGKDVQKIISAQKNNQYKKLPDSKIEIAGFILEKSDFEILFKSKDESSAKFCKEINCCIQVDLNITEELKRECVARDFIRIIQDKRKEMNLNIIERINVDFFTNDDFIRNAIFFYKDYISIQCLINNLNFTNESDDLFQNVINDSILYIKINK